MQVGLWRVWPTYTTIPGAALEIFLYLVAIITTVIMYEVARAVVFRTLRRRLKESTKAYVRRHEVRLDRFKLTRRAFLKTELLADPIVITALEARAREREVPVAFVYAEVEDYLDEIIPAFSLLSYFKVGLTLTRLVVHSVYDVIFERDRISRVGSRLPPDAVVLYLMNHRSNFDYLLVSLLLSRTIALSYAVGEWARVWPLDWLFRSFGSYFVRRGEKDPLYHLVLKRYVQKVGRYGITQGIFPEGGLTRDGFFREPKIGLLSYVTELLLDPAFDKELLVVPVAINYDRVLEDRVLVGELTRGEHPPSLFDKLRSGLWTLVSTPFVLGGNLFRVVTGQAKQHGYATASFGEPVNVRTFLDQGEEGVFAAVAPEVRKARVKALAQQVMAEIGSIMPVTPVPLVALAVLIASSGKAQHQGQLEVAEVAVADEVRRLRTLLRREGHWLVGGQALVSLRDERLSLDAEREERSSALLDLEDSFIDSEEARETLALGLTHLLRRRLVVRRGKNLSFSTESRSILTYYAATLTPLVPGAEDILRPGSP